MYPGKEKRYLIRVTGRNQPPLMEMTIPGVPGPETDRQEFWGMKSCKTGKNEVSVLRPAPLYHFLSTLYSMRVLDHLFGNS